MAGERAGKRRALWSGSISFGLVNIPVQLFPATASHDLELHQFQARTGHRIHYRRVAEGSGREVPYEQIVKGFEVAKGQVVLIEPEELEALEPKRSRTIEIEEFVELAEIDPMLWSGTYYIAPADNPGAQKSYELLRRAMEEAGKVGIGRFVMRTKEYLVTVRPLGPGLALETMYYADEIRDQREVAGEGRRAQVAARELALARQLVDALTTKWQPGKFKDTYRDRVKALIEQKARGEEIVAQPMPEEPAPVVDLMEALKASLDRGGSGRPGNGKRAHPAPRRPKGARAAGRARHKSP